MWEWFTTNSVWFFMASSFILIIVFFVGEQISTKILKTLPETKQERANKSFTVVFWIIDGITLGIIAVSLVAITLSREGIYNIITPDTIQRWFLQHATRILITLLLGIVLWYVVSKFLPGMVQRTMSRPVKGESKAGRKKRANTLTSVFTGVSKVLISLLVIFMILSELDVPIGPILAGFGIAGIAVGFGAQYMIRDLIAGIFILLENQYRVGDVARVADITGLVEQVNLRKTVLRDLDGIVHHVPNGDIKVASNYTRRFSRVNLNISVSYGTDLDKAINVINRVCTELVAEAGWKEKFFSTPQVLRVDKLGDSGIDIKIIGDVQPLEQWSVMGELRLRIKNTFDAEGIEIPWPHVKVFLGDQESGKALICPSCSSTNSPGSKFCSHCGGAIGSH